MNKHMASTAGCPCHGLRHSTTEYHQLVQTVTNNFRRKLHRTGLLSSKASLSLVCVGLSGYPRSALALLPLFYNDTIIPPLAYGRETPPDRGFPRCVSWFLQKDWGIPGCEKKEKQEPKEKRACGSCPFPVRHEWEFSNQSTWIWEFCLFPRIASGEGSAPCGSTLRRRQGCFGDLVFLRRFFYKATHDNPEFFLFLHSTTRQMGYGSLALIAISCVWDNGDWVVGGGEGLALVLI